MNRPEKASVTWTNWRKSSYSGGTAHGGCVEVASAAEAVGVRDSKNATGPTLAFTTDHWRIFLADVG